MNKKAILAILILSISLNFSGCNKKTTEKVEAKINTNQFEIISEEKIGETNDNLFIVKHKKTGKRFVIYKGHYKGGIAQLD